MDEATKKQNLQNIPAVGTVNKEGGISASIEHSMPEPNIPPEVGEAGVTTAEPEIPVQKDTGLSPHGENIQPSLEPSGNISINEAEERAIIKNGSGNSFDFGKHMEGIYFASSRIGLAILRLKNFLKSKITRQEV